MLDPSLMNQIERADDLLTMTQILNDHGIIDDIAGILNHQYQIIYNFEPKNDELKLETIDFDGNPVDFADFKNDVIDIVNQHR